MPLCGLKEANNKEHRDFNGRLLEEIAVDDKR